jgi:3-methylfumaryl-CoA hydratase
MQAGLNDWIGRSETRHDIVTDGIRARLEATIGSAGVASADTLAVLGHWCLFLPDDAMANLADDGHPHRGGVLPSVELPRRMWASGELNVYRPLRVGEAAMRTTTIEDVQEKSGRTGRLVFVTMRHEVFVAGSLAVSEHQHVVYREAADRNALASSHDMAPQGEWERLVTPTAALLFRFSALTFNAHRIHYDLPYTTEVEGYGGLVVHGPLLAMLLARHAEEHLGRPITSFEFRARKPVIAPAPFSLSATPSEAGVELWIRDAEGHLCMTANAT